MSEYKTPIYTRNANKRYSEKFDNINVRFPKGTKEQIEKLFGEGKSNEFIRNLVMAELLRLSTADTKTE